MFNSKVLWLEDAPPNWKLPKKPEIKFLKVKGLVSKLISARKQRNSPSNAEQAISIAAATADLHWHPPVLPFLLTQSLSSKQIEPTDNMRPNFDDNYNRH